MMTLIDEVNLMINLLSFRDDKKDILVDVMNRVSCALSTNTMSKTTCHVHGYSLNVLEANSSDHLY